MGQPSNRLALLGLFPAPDSAGGVQISGRVAWEHIGFESALLVSYGAARVPALPEDTADIVRAESKIAALRAALRIRSSFGAVLVWHLGLLRLLPLFRTSGARVALFLHGIESWRRAHGLTGWLLRRVSLFLSNSEYTWARFLDKNPELRCACHRVVPLGLGSPVAGPPPPPGDPPRALMISRLVRSEDYKGHREVIDAWPLVRRRLPDAELWIAGEGDLKEELQRLARERGLGTAVRFLGMVSEESKEEVIAASRCLAMPSRGEGFGLVYLEAMRLGRPCLVSNLDAGREVVNPPEAGLAVDPREPSSLADALVQLLTPGSEWDRWSLQARLRYETHFTARHFRERLLSALSPPAEWGLA